MQEGVKSYVCGALVFLAIFASVAIDTGIIPHFETIGRFFGVEGNSLLSTLTAFNGALVAGLLYGSFSPGSPRFSRLFDVTAILLVLGGVAALVATNIPAWILAWVILGFAAGLLSHVTWEFILNGSHSSKVTSSMISAQLSARPIGIALGVPVFGVIAGDKSWKFALIVFVFLAAFATLLLSLVAKSAERAHQNQPQENFSLLIHYQSLRNPGLLYLILGNVFYGMSYLGLYGALGIILAQKYDYSPQQIGYVFGILGAVEGGASFISPILFQRFRSTTVTAAFSVLSFVAIATMLSCSISSLWFRCLLIVFVFSARQIIYASFKSAGEAVAIIAPSCPIGTFVIMAAWSGFSLSSLILEGTIASYGLQGCSIILIGSYAIGLMFFFKFFRFDFQTNKVA